MAAREDDVSGSLARAVQSHVESLRASGVTSVPRSGTRSAPLRGARSGKGAQLLVQLAQDVEACRQCPLYRTRTHAVISDGSPNAQLMFIGEAPGRDEDLVGVPFVGKAGQLLTKMIEAMGLHRQDVYICNVLKDRPPGNRTPLPEEVDACLPFLERQLALVAPKVICSLGAVATKALLGPTAAITKMRGQTYTYRGITLVPTFHPAYLLRNPTVKKLAWADLKKIKSLLERSKS